MKIAILNTTILTANGDFGLKSISLEKAKSLIELNADNLLSAIGHQSTADILTNLLDVKIEVNRIQFKQEPGQLALCFKLNGRPEEGKILTIGEIEEIGYEFKLLYMKEEIITENTSDGYHTFKELYHHRMILFSVLCNSNKEKAWKSKLHADGTMFPDYFIIGIDTPKGQYSYHYKMENWDYFNVNEVNKAPEWDGHQPNDIERLLSL